MFQIKTSYKLVLLIIILIQKLVTFLLAMIIKYEAQMAMENTTIVAVICNIPKISFSSNYISFNIEITSKLANAQQKNQNSADLCEIVVTPKNFKKYSGIKTFLGFISLPCYLSY